MEAQRAAEMILGSSATSSVNSLNSLNSLPDQIYGNHPPNYGLSYGSHPDHPPQYPTQYPQMPQQQVRFAPQPYYAHLQHRTVYQGSHQYPVVMTDDLVSGTRRNGAMSPVRRFFLLLCTFDLLFLSLLWIIAILVTGKDLSSEIYQQVMEYTIHSSMFDCVCVSACRFLLFMIFYALLDISHWWVVTATTTGTVAFLVAKVLQYEWHHDPITYDVMLVLLSFILAWGEAWFFDFRMVPLETKAKEIWGSQGGGGDDERTPLIASQGGAGGMLERYIAGSTIDGSIANFYSPMESLENSEDEDDGDISEDSGIRIPRRFKRRRNKAFSDQEKEYKKMAEEVLGKSWNSLNNEEGWKLEKRLENGDMVQVKTINKKKVFRLTGYVDISPCMLLEELFYKVEQVPTWNNTLTESKIIQPIDEYTDVAYSVCAEAAGGVVSTRDFVSIRHWSLIDGVYVSAGCSIQHPAMPPQPKKVRGENGPTCYAMFPVEGSPERTLFRWLLDTDLKGWIPQTIIDKALSGAQFEYIQNIRNRAKVITSCDTASSVGSCVDATTS